MSWDPNQGQNPNQQGQYGGYNPPPAGGQQGNPYGGYNQPGNAYQQPYGAPPAAPVSPLGPSSIGMDPKIAAGLGYLIGIVGLVFFFIEKQNRFVKFNALQSVFLHFGTVVLEFVLFIPYIILVVATANSSAGSAIVLLFSCLFGLVGIAWFVGWLVALIQAFQGKTFKIPLIGDWADRIVSRSPGLV
jgi:uncharacterized membrane protein